MLSREREHPCAVMCRRSSLIDFARVPTSCKNAPRVRSREKRKLMTARFIITVIRRVRGRIAGEWMAGACGTLYIIPDTDLSS